MTYRLALFLSAALGAVSPALADGPIPDDRTPVPLYKPSFPYGAPQDVQDRPVTAPVSDLRDAIALAYWTNPTLLSERATLRANDARYPLARAAYGPQLNLRASEGYARDRIDTLFGTVTRGNGFSTTASLIFSQPLLTFGRLSSAEAVALGEIALARDQLRLTESRTILNVVTSYVTVIREREAMAIAQQNLDLLERQFSDESSRFRVREITATDLQQVSTRLETGRAQVLLAQGQVSTAEADFIRYVGAMPGTLKTPDGLDLGVKTLDEAYAVAEMNSPIVRGAQSREKISRAQVEAARAETRPEVTLNGSATTDAAQPYNDTRRVSEVRGNVAMTVPLIDSGARRARIEQARQSNQADWRLLDEAIRDTHVAVASAWNGNRSAQAAAVHYQLAADAAQKAYEGAILQEKAGARTTLDVLDLARDLLNVRTNYVTAQANEHIARATLLSAMGRLEGPLLVPNLTVYDPDVNFNRQKGRGGLPLLTPVASAIDKIIKRDTRSDRAIRDPAGALKQPEVVVAP